MEHQHRGRPGGEVKLLPLLERGQAKGRHIRVEEARGVRVEGRDDARAARFARPADRLARNRLVPLVETVEIAQRDDPAAQALGQGFAMVEPPHRAVSPRGLRPSESTRIALPPIAARISSSLKPSSISACVTCVSWLVSKRTVVAPS